MTGHVTNLHQRFAVGDRVQFMGAGHIMTVLRASVGGRWFCCVWLDAVAARRAEEFCVDDLIAVPGDGVTS